MNNEQRSNQGRHTGNRRTSGSSSAASAGQLARDRGHGWVRALTLGAGTASAVGATAIAVSLHGSAPTAGLRIAPAASTHDTTSVNRAASGDDSGSDDSTGSDSSSQTQQRQPAAPQPLQAAPPPASSNNPPAATSGGS